MTYCIDHQECRDDILRTKMRVDGHDLEFAQVNAKLDGMSERMDRRFDAIETKLTTFVNPILSVVITIMGLLLGFAGGVIAMLWRAL